MFRVALLFAGLVACRAHAVLPLTHTVVAPVPYSNGFGLGFGGYAGHGYSDAGHLGYSSQELIGHGYAGHGLLGHGYGAHHAVKRSPHYVPVGHLGGLGHGHLGAVGSFGVTGHVAPIISPVAVSHQSRVDVRSSPALVAQALPVVAPVVAPVIHAAPIHTGVASLHYGGGHDGGHYGSTHSHFGHY